jgi:hypothetical protein
LETGEIEEENKSSSYKRVKQKRAEEIIDGLSGMYYNYG